MWKSKSSRNHRAALRNILRYFESHSGNKADQRNRKKILITTFFYYQLRNSNSPSYGVSSYAVTSIVPISDTLNQAPKFVSTMLNISSSSWTPMMRSSRSDNLLEIRKQSALEEAEELFDIFQSWFRAYKKKNGHFRRRSTFVFCPFSGVTHQMDPISGAKVVYKKSRGTHRAHFMFNTIFPYVLRFWRK